MIRAAYAFLCLLSSSLIIPSHTHEAQKTIGSLLESLAIRIKPLTPSKTGEAQRYEQIGDSFFKEKKYTEALDAYEKAQACDAPTVSLYCKIGHAYYEAQNYQQSIDAYTKALEINRSYTHDYFLLARSYERINDMKAAEDTWKNIIIDNPTSKDACMEIARLLCDQQRFHESLYYLEMARAHYPDDTILLFQYANTLNTANKTEESLSIYEYLLKKHPNSSAITYNCAYTLKKLGRIEEALSLYDKTLQLEPEHTEAHFSRGLAYLAMGDFDRGWPEYEWRWKRDTQHMSERKFSQPLWDGKALNGKTILLHAEQGLGDTFQFIRFAKVAHDMGGVVIAAVQNPLVDILSLCPYIDRVLSLSTPLPRFDVHAPLMSVPLILHSNEKTIPHEIPYLYAHATLEQEWKERIAHDTNFKVGICWQGNANYSTPFLRAVVAAKSIPLKDFEPLFKIPGVTIYNLQKIAGEEQLKEIPKEWNLISFDSDFDTKNGRFMDTAALIKNLDLIISVDTGLAHIAAGLGASVWTFIPNPPDWRWMLDRTDTPWYPNMTLFRQSTSGDWHSVMLTIAERLEKLVTEKKHHYRSLPLADILEMLVSATINQCENPSEKRKNIIDQLHAEITHRCHAITDLAKIRVLTLQLAQCTGECITLIRSIQKNTKSPTNYSYQQAIERYMQLINEKDQIKKNIQLCVH